MAITQFKTVETASSVYILMSNLIFCVVIAVVPYKIMHLQQFDGKKIERKRKILLYECEQNRTKNG